MRGGVTTTVAQAVPVLARLLKAEVARIEAEAAQLQARLIPLRAVLELYDGKPANTMRKSTSRPAPAKGAAVGKPKDWALGLRLWNEQKSVPEIARAVGVTEASVYYHSKTWCKRPEQPRSGRPRGSEPKLVSATKRKVLMHSVACPSCGKATISDPCSRCNTVLPTSLGGAGSRSTGAEED